MKTTTPNPDIPVMPKKRPNNWPNGKMHNALVPPMKPKMPMGKKAC